MRVLSVNVGPAAEIVWEGRRILTGFRKRPVGIRLRLRGTNLEGDEQADRTVHGGARKTVYVYPSEHYAFWRRTLQLPALSWGAFGENLTTAGWVETEARVGDRVRIGSAVLEVTQPRSPCYKMNAAFGRRDMIERFHSARRSGFYLGLVHEGELGAGDSVELLFRNPSSATIAELVAEGDEPHEP